LLYILLAVFSALFLAVFQYIFKSKKKSQLNYWLSFLRFLIFFFIFLLFINPSVKKETTETIKPNLLVAVDNSTSIKYKQQDKTVSEFVQKIKADSELNSKFKIEYYSFGLSLKTLDSLNFDKNQTDLSKPFTEFSKIYKNYENPVILISDGNQTVGSNVEFSNYTSPVYSFVVGDTTVIEDIYINQLNVNKFTLINNQFPVEVFVNYTGKKALLKKLIVSHRGKRVFTKELSFNKAESTKVVPFYLSAEEEGKQYYSVKIETLEKEQNTINNTKSFSVNVIEEKSKILILSSINHPDLGMFKKSIESNKQRSVTILNPDIEIDKISDYQMVILYQPNNKFNKVIKEINNKKINYFIVSGVNTDWDFLNSIQNNFNKKDASLTEYYHPVFNSNYASFLNKDVGFSSFSPLEDQFGDVTFSVPFNSLLFYQIGTIKTEKPLLATFEKDSQKVGVLFGENSWTWRMNSFLDHKSFEPFDGFMANLIQYFSSNIKNKRLNVTLNPLYFSSEIICVSANYLDENFNIDNRATIWFTVRNKNNSYLKKIPFSFSNNRFILELSNIPPDEYFYTVSVENQDESISGNFKVLPFEVEQQFTQSNDKGLKMLSSKTGGRIYYNEQEKQLIEALNSENRFKSIQKVKIVSIPLIDWQWILGVIVFLLSLEWFTRKYFGKI